MALESNKFTLEERRNDWRAFLLATGKFKEKDNKAENDQATFDKLASRKSAPAGVATLPAERRVAWLATEVGISNDDLGVILPEITKLQVPDPSSTPAAGSHKRQRMEESNSIDINLTKNNLNSLLLEDSTGDDPQPLNNDWCNLVHTAEAGMKSTYTIYLRKEAKAILAALDQQNVLLEGAPGTGKSSLAWLWACKQHTFTVCWISAGTYSTRVITYLKKGKIVFSKPYESMESIKFLELPPAVNCLIVDGLTKDFREIFLRAGSWFGSTKEPKRLIITTSVQANIKQENLYGLDMERIIVGGWTLEDYKMALQDQGFAQQHLDVSEADEDLEAKFDVAGHSARWMFQFSLERAQHALEEAIEAADNTDELVKGFGGQRSNSAVNRLFTTINRVPHLVSRQATIMMIEKHEETFLKHLRCHDICKNPSVDGWVLEAEILLLMKKAEYNQGSTRRSFIVKKDVEDSDGDVSCEEEEWHVRTRHRFTNVSDLSAIKLEPDDYAVPKRWNQGCYDFVRILADGHLEFIQVTRAEKHQIKPKYMSLFIDAIGSKVKVKRVSMIFLVPVGTNFSFPAYVDNLPGNQKELFLTNGEKNVFKREIERCK